MGCEKCNYSGYSGRTIVEETFEVTSGFRDLISEKASQNRLKKYLSDNDFIPLKNHIRAKIDDGIILEKDVLGLLEEE